MTLGLATCARLPAKADETALEEALDAASIPYRWAVWDDPAVDWSAFGAVLVRTTWDYTAKVNDFLDWATHVARTSALWNPAEVIRWNAHKGYLVELGDIGVAVVPTVVVPAGQPTTAPPVADLATRAGWGGEVVVKPAASAGAMGAHRGTGDDPRLQRALDALGEAGRDAVVQPLIDSVTRVGETSLVVVDGVVTHAVRKTPAPGDYRSQTQWGAVTHAVDPDDEQVAVAHEAWRAASQLAGDLLYARVDLLDVDGQPTVIELELIEPDLFFGYGDGDGAAHALVAVLNARLDRAGDW